MGPFQTSLIAIHLEIQTVFVPYCSLRDPNQANGIIFQPEVYDGIIIYPPCFYEGAQFRRNGSDL